LLPFLSGLCQNFGNTEDGSKLSQTRYTVPFGISPSSYVTILCFLLLGVLITSSFLFQGLLSYYIFLIFLRYRPNKLVSNFLFSFSFFQCLFYILVFSFSIKIFYILLAFHFPQFLGNLHHCYFFISNP
jgi:hypothetical protein